MLFGYPRFSPEQNWVHECLVLVVQEIHRLIEYGARPKWPDVLPEVYRDALERRTGLRQRVVRYFDVLVMESPDVRERVLRAMSEQNSIASLLALQSECESAASFSPDICKVTLDLFEFGFDLLTGLGVRDAHYRTMVAGMPKPVCPFCGIEFLAAPPRMVMADDFDPAEQDVHREALDHYLARTVYPFAAANLANLPPMGSRCNTIKRHKDILRHADGKRRRAFSPYSPIRVSVSLKNSVPFGNRTLPSWEVSFDPYSEEVETWNDIFEVRNRYVSDVLNLNFKRWVEAFGCIVRRRLTMRSVDLSDAVLLEFLRDYCAELELQNLSGHESLQLPVFRWLDERCAAADRELLDFLKDAVPPHRSGSRI